MMLHLQHYNMVLKAETNVKYIILFVTNHHRNNKKENTF